SRTTTTSKTTIKVLTFEVMPPHQDHFRSSADRANYIKWNLGYGRTRVGCVCVCLLFNVRAPLGGAPGPRGGTGRAERGPPVQLAVLYTYGPPVGGPSMDIEAMEPLWTWAMEPGSMGWGGASRQKGKHVKRSGGCGFVSGG